MLGILLLQWRIFCTVEDIQYCGGCFVLWGIPSVLWWISAVLSRIFSTVEGYHQYFEKILSVMMGVLLLQQRIFCTVQGSQNDVGITSRLLMVSCHSTESPPQYYTDVPSGDSTGSLIYFSVFLYFQIILISFVQHMKSQNSA